jgi:hypothetical protein
MAQEDSTKTKESPRHASQPSDDENDGDENDTDRDQKSTSSEEDDDKWMNTSQNRTRHRLFSTIPLQTPAQKKKTKTKSSVPCHREPIDMPGA